MEEIKWSAPEFHYYEKTVSWYWILIIISVILTALALWQKNFLFAVFIILASFLIFMWASIRPKTIDFTLSEKGLDIDGQQFFSFQDISGFAIISDTDNSGLSELAVKIKRNFGAWIKIIIAEQKQEKIKEILKLHTSEIEYQE